MYSFDLNTHDGKKWYRLDGANEFSVLWASLFLLSLHNVTTAISLGEHGQKFHFSLCLCASVIIRYPESLSHASFLENTSLYGPVYCLIWPHLPLSPTSEILPLCPLKSRFIISKKGKKNNPKLTSHHFFNFYFFTFLLQMILGFHLKSLFYVQLS